MLPRRSAVTRYFLFAVIFGVGFVWLISDGHSKQSNVVDAEKDYDVWLTANESELLQELDKLWHEYGERGPLSTTLWSRNSSLLELRQQVLKLRQNRPKNPHPFDYVILPTSVCSGDIFLLVYIHSAPNHFRQRMAIRETWGNAGNFPNITVKVVFLLGIIATDEGRLIQEALLLEADAYGDIVQEDFIDSYRNLTYKGIMGLRWVSTYCRHARFLLKSDDDIFINIFSLVTHLQRLSSQLKSPVGKLLLCLVWYRMKVMRDPRSKWYLSPKEFPNDIFPVYCSGSAFIMTPDVAVAMYNASFHIPFFWVDDFYVTGLLARAVGVTHQNFNSVYALSPSTFLQKFTESNVSMTLVVGHVHKINAMKIVWNNVLSRHSQRKPVILQNTEKSWGSWYRPSDVTIALVIF